MIRQRHMHICSGIFATALSCMPSTVLPAPKAVQSTLVPESIGICSRLPDRLTAQDMYWVRSRLDEAFPTRQATLLQKVRFEEDPNDELLGPQFRDNGSGELILRLPQHYMKRLCHQILLQTVYAGKFDTLSDMNAIQLKQMQIDAIGLGRRTKECYAALGNEPKCLDREILAYLRQSGAIHDGIKIDSEDENTLALVYGAAEFFIAHEALHAIAKAAPNDSRWANLTEKAEETEADLYALQHLFGQQNLPLAPMMAMATTSLIERDPIAGGSHPADICRYQQMRAVFARSAPTLFKLASFMAKGELFENDAEASKFVKEALQYPFMHGTSALGICGSDTTSYVDAAITDLNSYFDPIIARLRRLGIDDFSDLEDANLGIDSAEFEKMITGFESRRWKSQIGKRIAVKYLYYIAIGSEFSAERKENLEDAFENERNATAARLASRSMTNLTRVYQRLGPAWFNKEERLLIDIGIEGSAIIQKDYGTASSYKRQGIIRRYNASIDRSISRNDFDLLNYIRANIYFVKISPSLAQAYFPRHGEIQFLVQTYTTNEVALGNCGDPKFLANTLMNRIASEIPGAENLDRAGCQEIKAGQSEN
jgi:hypothetical protein